MYNLISLILILLSLSIIIVLVVRKFPMLSSLDVENMPAEKEAKFKERILSGRLKRSFFKWWVKINKLWQPSSQFIANFFQWALNKLNELKTEKKPAAASQDRQEKINQLFQEAEEAKKQADEVAAEKKLIEIIGLDSKNIRAFKELGRFYFEQGNFEEAKQTFEHILKLKQDDEDIYDSLAQIAKEKGDLNLAREEYLRLLEINKQSAQTYFNLALVYQAMGNIKEAIAKLKKALKIEPNNPRYLDTMIEISIINKDKFLALDAFKKLVKVNPENQKIKEFKKQIDLL